MKTSSSFLSVVIVLADEEYLNFYELQKISDYVSGIAEDYEIILIDNSDSGGYSDLFTKSTSPEGMPNLQIFSEVS